MSKNSKAFNKGDAVTYISSWDRKGTVVFRHAIVYSCGKKQMVLTDAETGEEMGRHFRPENETVTPSNLGPIAYIVEGATYPRLTDEEATEKCLALGAKVVSHSTAQYKRMLIVNADADRYYLAGLRESLTKLHAPEGISYSVACARIETARAARS